MPWRYIGLHFSPAMRIYVPDFTYSLLRSSFPLGASAAGLGLDVLRGRGALHRPMPAIQALRALVRQSAVARTPPIDSFPALAVLESTAQLSTIVVVRLPVHGTVTDRKLWWWCWGGSVGGSGDRSR